MELLKPLTLAALLSEIGRICVRSERYEFRQLDCDQATLRWLNTRNYDDLKAIAEILEDADQTGTLHQARSIVYPAERHLFNETPSCKTVPLTSLLSRVSILKREAGEAKVIGPGESYSFPLTSMSEHTVFPKPSADLTNSPTDYDSLLTHFEKDFDIWLRSGRGIGPLLMVLEKHLHCVPLCPGSENPDGKEVSLFDHVKITAAVTAALYRFEQEEEGTFSGEEAKVFSFIGGDISGLQDFLYSLSSKGALKTLRARSFFLELLCEHCVSELVSALQLTEASIIYCAGGRFNILSHNSRRVQQVLKSFQDRINQSLRGVGDLMLILAAEPASIDEIRSGEVIKLRKALGQRLSQLKTKKHFNNLKDVLAPKEPLHQTASCSVCNTDDLNPEEFKPLEKDQTPGPEDKIACPFCWSMAQLGSKLGIQRYIAGSVSGSSDLGFILPCHDGYSINYRGYREKGQVPQNASRVFCLNSWEIRDFLGERSRQILVANEIRKRGELNSHGQCAEKESSDDESSASFDGLASCSRGLNRIGILRMDVDNLGSIFSTGLGNQVSFPRLANLSRTLNLFFKQQLPGICEGDLGTDEIVGRPMDFSQKEPSKQGRNVSVVYSGGDDLFMVGAWDELAEVSFDIWNSFKAYCGLNPAVTISGGMIVNSTTLPLHTLAQMAGEAEHQAKRQGRNRITLFSAASYESGNGKVRERSYTIPWDAAEKQVFRPLKLLLALSELGEDENLFKPYFSSGLVYSLLGMHELWRYHGKLYLPRMAYLLARLQLSLKKIEDESVENTKAKLFNLLMSEREMEHLHIPLLWFAMLCRHTGDRQE